MTPASSERREYFRCDLPNVVELVAPEKGKSDQFKGVTINVSETGMCLFVFQPVWTNERLLLVKSMLPISHRGGSVRWVNRLAQDFYKIGLMFDREDLPDAEFKVDPQTPDNSGYQAGAYGATVASGGRSDKDDLEQ